MPRFTDGDLDVRIQGVSTPTADTDAANKAYVDANSGGGGGNNLTAGAGIDITSDVISVADDGITTAKLATGAVDTDALSDLAVSNGKIVDATIQNTKLNITNNGAADDLVLSKNGDNFTWVANGGGGGATDNITASGGLTRVADDISVATNGITNEKIADNSILNRNLATNAVDTDSILNGSVATDKIADNAVSTDKIADLAVSSGKIAVGGVGTTQVADDAITTNKLAVGSNGSSGQILTSDGDGTMSWEDSPVPPLPTEFGSPVYTENFKSDGEFYDDGSQVNLTNGEIARAPNGSTGNQYIAHSAGDGIEYTLDSGNHLRTGIADNGVTTSKVIDGAITNAKLASINLDFLSDVDTTTDVPADNDVLTWSQSDTTWKPERPLVADIREGGHIDISKDANNHYTLAFNERYELWGTKSDWIQITSGTPTGDNILWDSSTSTLTVPSVNGRESIDILGSARTGMAVQIRQANNSVNPVGYRSGFYQITDIDVSLSPDQVIIQLLADGSDIFEEGVGSSYTYELTVLQFVSGGSVNNLTLDGLADVDVSTTPTDGQVLTWDTASSTYKPADGSVANTLGGLSDVDITTPADNDILTYNATTTNWESADIANSIDLATTLSVVNGELGVSTASLDARYFDIDVDGTDGQVLARDATSNGLVWKDAGTGTSTVDYENAAYGNISDGSITSWSYNQEGNPITQGEVSITSALSPTTGYEVSFREADIDTDNLVSVSLFQIGFGSPIEFATYVVTTTSIDSGFVNITLAGGTLSGNDILATLPDDNTSLSISVSVREFTSAAAGATTIGQLTDVNNSNPMDGYLLRYDGTNNEYRAHSTGNTLSAYGGINVAVDSSSTAPTSSGTHSISLGDDAQATGDDSVAVGTDANATNSSAIALGHATDATGLDAIALGKSASASGDVSMALGASSTASFQDSVALGDGSSAENINDFRLGNSSNHITVHPDQAGTEGLENQLVSKKYVDNQISNANVIVSDNVNGIQTITYDSTNNPWGTYRINPYEADLNTRNIATSMQSYDAGQSQYIFFPNPFQKRSSTEPGEGGLGISEGALPIFFEEIGDVGQPNNVGGIDGNDSNSLGWKYTGFRDAAIWVGTATTLNMQFRWVNHDASNASIFPPQVTTRLQMVHVKPTPFGDSFRYLINDDSAVVIAETINERFTNPTRVPAGETRAHDVPMTLAVQTRTQGITGVAKDDMIAFQSSCRIQR